MVSETCVCDKQIIGGAEFQQSLSTVVSYSGPMSSSHTRHFLVSHDGVKIAHYYQVVTPFDTLYCDL